MSPQHLPPIAPGLACTLQVERGSGQIEKEYFVRTDMQKSLSVTDRVATKYEEIIERIDLGKKPLAMITRNESSSSFLPMPQHVILTQLLVDVACSSLHRRLPKPWVRRFATAGRGETSVLLYPRPHSVVTSGLGLALQHICDN